MSVPSLDAVTIYLLRNYGFFSGVLIGLREARRIYGFHRPRATRQDENCVDFLCSHPLVTNYLEDQKKQNSRFRELLFHIPS